MRPSRSDGAGWPEKELKLRLRRGIAGRLFGFEPLEVQPGRAVLEMRVRSRHKQIHGVVHGGILASLADTAGGLATYGMLPRGTRLATVEMKINYLEPVDRGTIVAEARVIRMGRHFAVVDCEIRQPDGRLAAKALATYARTSIQAGRKKKGSV